MKLLRGASLGRCAGTRPKFRVLRSSAPSKVGCLEIVGANISNGEHDPGGSFWSRTGAHFNETVASKSPVDPRLPTAALEQADTYQRVVEKPGKSGN